MKILKLSILLLLLLPFSSQAQFYCKDTVKLELVLDGIKLKKDFNSHCEGNEYVIRATIDSLFYLGKHQWEQSFDSGKTWNVFTTSLSNNIQYKLSEKPVWIKSSLLDVPCQTYSEVYKLDNIRPKPAKVIYKIDSFDCQKGFGRIITLHDIKKNPVWFINFEISIDPKPIISDKKDTLIAAYAGHYIYQITDQSYTCSTFDTVTVPNLKPLDVSINLKLDTNCTEKIISASPIVKGGTPPFSYYWKTNWIGGWADKNIYDKSHSGTLILLIEDGNKCSYVKCLKLQQPSSNYQFTQNDYTEYHSTCTGKGGSIDFHRNVGVPPLKYKWSNGATTEDLINVPPDDYYLTITDSKGCIYTTGARVKEDPEPFKSYIKQLQRCIMPTDISAEVFENKINFSKFKYLWNTGDTSKIIKGATTLQTYYLTVTSIDYPECKASPMFSFTPLKYRNLIYDSSFTQLSCYTGKKICLKALTFTPPTVYYWNGKVDSSCVTVKKSGLYTIVARDGDKSCVDSIKIAVKVLDPKFEVDGSDTLCFGSKDSYIKIKTNDQFHKPLSYSINGKNFSTQKEYYNLPSGNYSVTIKDSLGCLFSNTVSITELDKPLRIEINPKDTFLFSNSELSISTKVNVKGKYNYEWLPNEGLSCDNCPNPKVFIDSNKNYMLKVENDFGCSAVDTLNIRFGTDNLYFPTAFSPNNDNVNDQWEVFVTPGIEEIIMCNIYDRWGSLIFKKEKIKTGEILSWDGFFNGKKCDTSVFTYSAIVRRKDGVILKKQGDFMLVE